MPAHTGALAPADVNTCPAVPAAVNANAVPVPYAEPPAVAVAVELVPPLPMARVPPTVTAPVVVVAGVSPVLPKVIELTPEPAPENCDQVIAVTLIVPPALLVQTQPVSASVVPVSTKTYAPGTCAHVLMSGALAHAVADAI